MASDSAMGPADSPDRSPLPSSREERRSLAAANELEWLAFPALEGTHLSWKKGRAVGWDLVSADGAIWATRRGSSIVASGQNYEIQAIFKNKRRNYIYDRHDRQELVDAAGSVELNWTGAHYAGRARTVLSLGGTDYEFPIRGGKYKAKIVMPAVEIGGSAQPIARFRLTCGWYRAAQGRSPRPVEVVVSPDSISTDQMGLVIAVASSWLRSFFDSPGAS